MGFFLSSTAPTSEDVKTAMSHVAQTDTGWPTQWSMVYDQNEPYVTWYFDGDFTQGISLPILSDSHSR